MALHNSRTIYGLARGVEVTCRQVEALLSDILPLAYPTKLEPVTFKFGVFGDMDMKCNI